MRRVAVGGRAGAFDDGEGNLRVRVCPVMIAACPWRLSPHQAMIRGSEDKELDRRRREEALVDPFPGRGEPPLAVVTRPSERKGAIFYSLVARGKVVLAECTARSGCVRTIVASDLCSHVTSTLRRNFPTVTRLLLSKITADDAKMSFVYDDYVFHYIVQGGITVLCMVDAQLTRRLAFLFLNDIKDRFASIYGDRAQTAIAFAMNTEFARVLSDRMEYFNDNPIADPLRGRQVDDAKGIMLANIGAC